MTESTDPWLPDPDEMSEFQRNMQEGLSDITDADIAFGDAIDEAFDTGYDIGFKVGYQFAVTESYPELKPDGHA